MVNKFKYLFGISVELKESERELKERTIRTSNLHFHYFIVRFSLPFDEDLYFTVKYECELYTEIKFALKINKYKRSKFDSQG